MWSPIFSADLAQRLPAMPIRVVCHQCQKAFRTGDENAGKRTKCPGCGTPLTIPATDGNGSAAGAAASGTLSAFGGSSSGGGAAENTWHLATADGQQHGPISKAELDHWVAEGRIQAHFNVFCQGWTEWCPAGNVYPQLAQQAAAVQAAVTQAAMAQAAAAQSAMGMSLAGGMPGSGYPAAMTGMPMSDPLGGAMASSYGLGGGMAASPYAAPATSSYVAPRRKKGKTDVPGIVSVSMGGTSLLLFLAMFACTAAIPPIGVIGMFLVPVMALAGFIVGFFGRSPLKIIGLILNGLALLGCGVMVIAVFVIGAAFVGAASRSGGPGF